MPEGQKRKNSDRIMTFRQRCSIPAAVALTIVYYIADISAFVRFGLCNVHSLFVLAFDVGNARKFLIKLSGFVMILSAKRNNRF